MTSLTAVALIARRELRTRLQQKGYRASVAITMLIVIAVCVVPSFISGSNKAKTYDIGLSAPPASLATSLTSTAARLGVKLRLHDTTPTRAESMVRTGDWDAAIVGTSVLAAHKTDAAIGIIQQAHAGAQVNAQLRRAGLSQAQIQQALRITPLHVRATGVDESAQRTTIATVAVIALFTQLVAFCTWVAMGVVEEKSSRVVELILSSVRPMQLLAGKLLGIGALALGQVTLIGVVALIAANAAGTLTIPVSAIGTVLVSLAGFVFGFAFFASLAASLAATVSRQEEVSAILAPMTVLLTASYVASLAVASSHTSTATHVLSIIPPISAVAMPARIARGGVPVLDVIAAIVLLVLTTAAVIVVGSRIYRASILHTGSRVKLREAWRGDAVSG